MRTNRKLVKHGMINFSHFELSAVHEGNVSPVGINTNQDISAAKLCRSM
jgi:hypothetical protein